MSFQEERKKETEKRVEGRGQGECETLIKSRNKGGVGLLLSVIHSHEHRRSMDHSAHNILYCPIIFGG